MSHVIDLGSNRAIELDPIIHMVGRPAILLSLAGEVHGKVHNCALIPLHKLEEFIAGLRLVASAAKG